MFTLFEWGAAIQNAFAGIWPIVAKFGTAGIAVAACLAFAWFSPIFKKTALWVALAIVVYLVSYSIGVSDGEKRTQAQWNATIDRGVKIVEKARTDSEHYDAGATPDELRRDPYNRDNPARSAPVNAGKGKGSALRRLAPSNLLRRWRHHRDDKGNSRP